jgi:hypothetical protein
VVASELVPDRSAPDVRALVEDVRLGVVRLGSLTLDAIHSAPRRSSAATSITPVGSRPTTT